MATVSNVTTEIINTKQDGITMHTLWESLTTTNRPGDALVRPNYKDVCIQVRGTFGASASIAIEGTNDITSETWAALDDTTGTTIALTAAGIIQLGDTPYKIRPVLSNGDGSTDIDVTVVASTTARR